MTDEARRRLEREARYEKGLAAFLVCLRDGHAALGILDASEVRDESGRAVPVEAKFCSRCHLVYWETDERAIARHEREARERANERQRLDIERDEEDRRRRDIGGTYRP